MKKKLLLITALPVLLTSCNSMSNIFGAYKYTGECELILGKEDDLSSYGEELDGPKTKEELAEEINKHFTAKGTTGHKFEDECMHLTDDNTVTVKTEDTNLNITLYSVNYNEENGNASYLTNFGKEDDKFYFYNIQASPDDPSSFIAKKDKEYGVIIHNNYAGFFEESYFTVSGKTLTLVGEYKVTEGQELVGDFKVSLTYQKQ